MTNGKEYLVGLDQAPTIEPKEGGWALIRYANGRTVRVSPVLTTHWINDYVVHIFALENGPDPTLNTDELVYRNDQGDGESRIIVSLNQLN